MRPAVGSCRNNNRRFHANGRTKEGGTSDILLRRKTRPKWELILAPFVRPCVTLTMCFRSWFIYTLIQARIAYTFRTITVDQRLNWQPQPRQELSSLLKNTHPRVSRSISEATFITQPHARRPSDAPVKRLLSSILVRFVIRQFLLAMPLPSLPPPTRSFSIEYYSSQRSYFLVS